MKPRADGGRHVASNLITLCGAHHRALHRGQLSAEGTVEGGLTFRHANGNAYGISHTEADAGDKAFRALRGLGFAEGEARRALAESAHVGTGDPVENLVRRCLLLLTERRARAS